MGVKHKVMSSYVQANQWVASGEMMPEFPQLGLSPYPNQGVLPYF